MGAFAALQPDVRPRGRGGVMLQSLNAPPPRGTARSSWLWHLPGVGSCKRDPREKMAQGQTGVVVVIRTGVSDKEPTGIPTPKVRRQSLEKGQACHGGEGRRGAGLFSQSCPPHTQRWPVRPDLCLLFTAAMGTTPVPGKAGRCPAGSAQEPLPSKLYCFSDESCPGGQKCCSLGRMRICVQPALGRGGCKGGGLPCDSPHRAPCQFGRGGSPRGGCSPCERGWGPAGRAVSACFFCLVQLLAALQPALAAAERGGWKAASHTLTGPSCRQPSTYNHK